MDAAEMLDRLRGAAAPLEQLDAPMAPGVYAWFLDDPSALPTLAAAARGPLYVGSSSNLAQREFDTHFQAGKTGFSTLRRSLGALLKSDLGLEPRPRGTGASATNYRCYRFDDVGEERLSSWMREHLRVNVQADENPEMVERDVIALACPPLNLKGWANPHAAEIKAMRKACSDEARRKFPR